MMQPPVLGRDVKPARLWGCSSLAERCPVEALAAGSIPASPAHGLAAPRATLTVVWLRCWGLGALGSGPRPGWEIGGGMEHTFTTERPGPFFIRLHCSCGESWLVASADYVEEQMAQHLAEREEDPRTQV